MDLLNPTVQSNPATQYRIIFLDGAWIDMAPPPGFHFPTFITTCRSTGFLLSDQAYIRFDLVRCVLAWQNGKPPDMPKMQTAPSVETKQ